MSYSGGSLSVGAVKRIYDKNEYGTPILQIVDIKKIIGNGGRERYRFVSRISLILLLNLYLMFYLD